jgi:lipopolysaccharide transport system ATP-binding protein
MSDIAISVKNLGKKYYIGSKQEKYKTFRDTVSDIVVSPFKKAYGLLSGRSHSAANLTEEMWALKDLSFDIKHGEVVGIIGRNGAGKSTLLKILSRITEPSLGYVDIYGRVGALLEVGTGFHPELTGRENIYLNGTILGMGRKEINRKFDEIVDFAGVEKFIDTPVKHYSSGMGLRLGFAVAAHLEPDILIVDEVLAVGDAEFQKKCLGKMGDVASEGRTVLFVSHNMAAVQTLCSKAIVLNAGKVIMNGDVDEAISFYLNNHSEMQENTIDLTEAQYLPSSGHSYLRYLRVMDEAGTAVRSFNSLDPITLAIGIELTEPLLNPQLNIGVVDWMGNRLFTPSTFLEGVSLGAVEGCIEIICRIPPVPLIPGSYHLKLYFGTEYGKLQVIEHISNVFEIGSANIFSTGKIPAKSQGVLMLNSDWKVLTDLEKNPKLSVEK